MSLTPSEFERHYLVAAERTAQSGCNTGEAGWEIGRRPISSAVHRGGTFLDVGCANGLLMESLVEWCEHPVEPYGLDFAPRILELARSRLPHWSAELRGWGYEPELELAWRSASGRVNELAALGVPLRD